MGTPSTAWRGRIVGGVASVLLCGGMLLAGSTTQAGAATTTPTPTPTSAPNSAPAADELERQKLEEEVRQLRLANSQAEGWLGAFLPWAPFATVLIAVVTLGAALYKQSRDLAAAGLASNTAAAQWRADFARQQEAEAAKNEQWRQEFLRQQQLDRAAAEQEELGRFDETLSRISAQISSDNPGLSLNGAAALGLFVKPRYQELHADLLRIIIANLKAAPQKEVAGLLRDDLARVLGMLFAGGQPNPDVPSPLDLTNLPLSRLDLHGLTLPEEAVLDLAFATLDDANLSEMTMFRARGFKAKLDGARFSRTIMSEARFNEAHAIEKPVHFHETTLVSATFDGARLPGAEFQRAQLQGAKFRRGCDLRGARFEGADVNDAYFQGAVFDEAALRSMALGAHNWPSAHVDEPALKRMREIAAAAN